MAHVKRRLPTPRNSTDPELSDHSDRHIQGNEDCRTEDQTRRHSNTELLAAEDTVGETQPASTTVRASSTSGFSLRPVSHDRGTER